MKKARKGKVSPEQNEAEAWFLAAAARGNPARGLRLLEKLNRLDRKHQVLGDKP